MTAADHVPPTPPCAYQPPAPVAAWAATPIDVPAWDAAARRLAAATASAPPAARRRAFDTVTRAAAFDTGAIETLYVTDRRLTMAIAARAPAWRASLGPAVLALFAAQLHGLRLAHDAARRGLPVTEAWIRALHQVICAAQPTVRVLTHAGWQDQAFARGAYKSLPNDPWRAGRRIHAHAPPAATPGEMRRLVDDLRSAAFATAHPIVQAACAHHALVAIHPFQDGNGRVARALASVSLLGAAGIPLLVFDDQGPAYFDALAQADRGERQALADFVLRRAVDAIDVAVGALGG